jgi:RNA polymerase sigma-70 factor (ECF subfamily)
MDNAAFSELYTRYYKRSFLFVKSYVRDDMAAEDIVSESLIHLWQTMKKETVEHPQALLVLILKNGALNYLKHQAVKQAGFEAISSAMIRDMNYRITSLEACDPKELFSAEILEIIGKTLQSLPEQTRTIFEMSRYELLSVKEIAETLTLSSKSVEYHITKSLKALRISLKDYLPLLFL